ncbi:Hypothetical predicted protein [Olea europaea subsp. europaea]|uniref:Uncharacterized protein n=1 Tax=Olea europaea subsp. europaea TaxID=158383 RepID=A0A8S0PZR1_OLEEU|nr:Hypothetical predicted protein [Olea europaea subsp. europaea]
MGKKSNSNNRGRLPISVGRLPNQDGRISSTSQQFRKITKLAESTQGKEGRESSTNPTDSAKTFWQEFDHANSNSLSLSQTLGDEDTDSEDGSTAVKQTTNLSQVKESDTTKAPWASLFKENHKRENGFKLRTCENLLEILKIAGGSSQLAEHRKNISANLNKATTGQNIVGGSSQPAVDSQNTANNTNKATTEQSSSLEATTSQEDPTGQNDTSGQTDANAKLGAPVDQNEDYNPFIEVGRNNKAMNVAKGLMPKRITPQPIASDKVHVQKSGAGVEGKSDYEKLFNAEYGVIWTSQKIKVGDFGIFNRKERVLVS